MKKPERRDYRNADGTRLPSVTTVIGQTLGWSKDGLIGWSYRAGVDAMAGEMAAFAADVKDTATMDLDVLAERAKERRAHQRQRDAAASAGTLAHAMIEANVNGETMPTVEGVDPAVVEAAQRAFGRFLGWYVRTDPTIMATEQALVDEERGFGGTFDAIATLGGAVVLLDWKTGKDVYDEVVIQLGAYDHLAALRKLPAIDAAAVVNVPVDGDVQVVTVPRAQLDLGREAFFGLLAIYKNKRAMALSKGTK